MTKTQAPGIPNGPIKTRFNRHGCPGHFEPEQVPTTERLLALSHVDTSCTLFALSAQLSMALPTLIETQTQDVASATNALLLSSYTPSHGPGRSLKLWPRTSATLMKEPLIHLSPPVSLRLRPAITPIGARPYA
ncbi:uncharacterized protein ARMOST_11887 [Armillaria ostoyae]|uniref:Uncharacterized protein n=1 Tax=Armillaria ostoyae TaxID=47428 RepID=A0A284RIF0_ARMOS|nr:uncharacterized protein ARMOST_11887 [Armillaria ostoyae]